MSFHVPERCRIRTGPMASDATYGNNGAFFVPGPGARGLSGPRMTVIASDGMGWEHVSASLPNRCPTWDEMCHIKGIFWDDTDCVVQFHPPRSEYVNNHPYCLHLWRPTEAVIPMPPSLMVGIKSAGTMTYEQARAVDADAVVALLEAGVRDA
jgi:hypothetical protein